MCPPAWPSSIGTSTRPKSTDGATTIITGAASGYMAECRHLCTRHERVGEIHIGGSFCFISGHKGEAGGGGGGGGRGDVIRVLPGGMGGRSAGDGEVAVGSGWESMGWVGGGR